MIGTRCELHWDWGSCRLLYSHSYPSDTVSGVNRWGYLAWGVHSSRRFIGVSNWSECVPTGPCEDCAGVCHGSKEHVAVEKLDLLPTRFHGPEGPELDVIELCLRLGMRAEAYNFNPGFAERFAELYHNWLVVWNIFYFPYTGINHPNWLIFFRGLKPPTR